MPARRDDITEEGVRKLASYGCTHAEIADFFNCSVSTVEHRFAEALKLGKADLRTTLRRWQLRNARKGSDTMLIHLGKQYLGQAEKIEQKQEIEGTILALPDNGTSRTATGPAVDVPGEQG